MFGKHTSPVGGIIGFFGISEWWVSTFSDIERKHIVDKYTPLGGSGDRLEKGDNTFTTETPVNLLSNLAGWFNSEEERTIAYRLLDKAEALVNDTTNILDMHFLYNNMIRVYYRQRNADPDAMPKAIKACNKQIGLSEKAKSAFLLEYKGSALPTHLGYEQLAIIEEKKHNFDAAIRISKLAKEQGWDGEWQKRIERCTKKLKK